MPHHVLPLLLPLLIVAGLPADSTRADEPGFLVPAASATPAVYGSLLEIRLDFAHILALDEAAGTVAVGNDGIVRATLSDDQTIVLTGLAPGTTNLVVLDASGDEIYNTTVRVVASGDYLVTVYRGSLRQTYSCGSRCTPVVSIGDDGEFFSTAVTQVQARKGLAGEGQGAP